MSARRLSGLGMARSFSSHCRSVREDSAEYPNKGRSSATTCVRIGASERPAKNNTAMITLRFILPPEMEQVFCLNGESLGIRETVEPGAGQGEAERMPG